MSRSRWRFAPYTVVAVGAITGQVLAGIEHLAPTVWIVVAAIVLVAISIEGGAVWMAYLAKQRGDLGESVVPFFVISTLFAALAVGINVLGHWGEIWGVTIFGGLSAAGYVIWCFELNAMLDDAWDPDGTVRIRVPSMRILKKFGGDPDLAARARRIALIYAQENRNAEGLGPAQAIAAAHTERVEEQRRQRIEASVRLVMKEAGAHKTDVELAMLAYGPEQITEALIGHAANGDMAAALGSRISPLRLTGIDPNRPGRVPRALREQSPEPPPTRKVIEGDMVKPERKALPARTAPDPWEKYAGQLRAVMVNEPDWYERVQPVTCSQIEGALTHALANGTLAEANMSKPYLLKLKWMIEALSCRAVPQEQWETGALRGINREGLDERRNALLTS